MDKRMRVAVLGGGMGSLAAVFWLVRDAERARRLDITVYQRGHLLGGKGASGRDMEKDGRIEEHGLHVLLGFYDNVFHLLRTVYGALREERILKPSSDADCWWRDVLEPKEHIVLMERAPGGEASAPGSTWAPWPIHLDRRKGEIGEMEDVLHDHATLRSSILGAAIDHLGTSFGGWLRLGRIALAATKGPIAAVNSLFEWDLPAGERRIAEQPSAEASVAAIEGLLSSLFDDPDPEAANHVRTLVKLAYLRHALTPDDPASRHRMMGIAFFFGVLAGLLPLGRRALGDLSEIDHKDFRAWLGENLEGTGVPEALSTRSPLVSSVYDLVFAREGEWAAGCFVRNVFEMYLGYKDYPLYFMKGGMGDIVFAPLYLFLRSRGVKFRFFHRITRIEPAAEAAPPREPGDPSEPKPPAPPSVGAVHFAIEERPSGDPDYDPLVWSQGVPWWPSRPKEAFLKPCAPTETGQLTVRRGVDFDVVIAGVSVAALHHIAGDLKAVSPRFEQMVASARTRATAAVQLWMSAPTDAICTHPSLCGQVPRPVVGCYEKPFNAWADMTCVAETNRWSHESPRGIQYLCDGLDDDPPGVPYDPERSKQQVKTAALAWLRDRAAPMWDGFSWEKLLDREGRAGEARFEDQYWRANVEASDRYVLPVPGTLSQRLAAGDSTFENLYLAGDWVKNPIDAGSVEGAAMAGRAAATAILQRLDRDGAGLGAFIESDGDWSLRHPVEAKRVRLWGFVVRADFMSLAARVASMLAHHARDGVIAAPASRHAILTFAEMPEVRSTDSGVPKTRPIQVSDADKGYLAERDFAVWVPVLVKGPSGLRVAWVIPYIHVDNDISVSLGREIYGLLKQRSWISMPDSPVNGARFCVETAMIDKFDRGKMPVRGELLEVACPDGIRVGAPWRGAADLRDAYLSVLDPEDRARWPTSADAAMQTDLLVLRQVRDAAAPSDVAFSELVLASLHADRFVRGGQLDGQFSARFADAHSISLPRTLGVAAQSAVSLAFEVEFDMVLGKASALARWSRPLR